MNNKFSVSLVSLVLFCSLGSPLYTASNESVNAPSVIYQLSDTDLKNAQEECKAIAVKNEMKGNQLNSFVYECFIDTVAVNYESSNEFIFTAEEHDMSALEDEIPVEFEEPNYQGEEGLSYGVG